LETPKDKETTEEEERVKYQKAAGFEKQEAVAPKFDHSKTSREFNNKIAMLP